MLRFPLQGLKLITLLLRPQQSPMPAHLLHLFLYLFLQLFLQLFLPPCLQVLKHMWKLRVVVTMTMTVTVVVRVIVTVSLLQKRLAVCPQCRCRGKNPGSM